MAVEIIRITDADFSTDDVIKNLKKPEVGCVVSFVGVVRGTSKKKIVDTVEIEAYNEMGRKTLQEIAEKAKGLYQIEDVSIIHRTGKLRVGDNIVCIAVSAGHRKDAFKACEWLINELKKIVPIWKKEIYK
ncbi:MAG: molybdenum cofactor biosynthesis protein MoaE [Candidatus Helarchaeota archaeon]